MNARARTLLRIAVAAATLTALSLASPDRALAQADADRPSATPSGGDPAPSDPWDLSASPSIGPDDALVTIVAFSDFQCPFCSRVLPTLDQLREDPAFAGGVRVVFKHMPLSFHPDANLAAQAAAEAHAQGRFWAYHDLLFANQRALGREQLEAYAREVGLDLDAFRAALDDGRHVARVDADAALASTLGVRGTPQFRINGHPVTGARPYGDFAAVVRAEHDAMQALLDAGVPLAVARAQRRALNQEAAAAAAERARRPQRDEPPADALMRLPVGDSPTLGPADALVTIVVFSEFECPFCARVLPTLERVRERYGDDVRLVFKHQPLAFHENARPAALAAWAAHQQGAFWAYHDLLFANRRALDDDNFVAWADALGLDAERFAADRASSEAEAQVDADVALAAQVGAPGTPHFFVNGRRLRGAQPFERFVSVCDAALDEARALVAEGVPREDVYESVQAAAFVDVAAAIEGHTAVPPLADALAMASPFDTPAVEVAASAELAVATWAFDFERMVELLGLTGEDRAMALALFAEASGSITLAGDGSATMHLSFADGPEVTTGEWSVEGAEENVLTIALGEPGGEPEPLHVVFFGPDEVVFVGDGDRIPARRVVE